MAAATEEPKGRLREGVTVAIIAAVAALTGSLIGGGITYFTDKSVQKKKNGEGERRERIAAEALVRLLISEYHIDADRLQQMIALREYDLASFREHTFVSRV